MIYHPNSSKDHFFLQEGLAITYSTPSVISWPSSRGHSQCYVQVLQDQEYSAPDTDRTQHLIIHFTVVAWYPGHGARPSRGEQQTLCLETLRFEDMLRFDGGAVNTLPYRGVAGKGSGKGRRSELVMNYVWKQPKSNVLKPFRCLVYWKSQSNLFSCTDHVGKQHQMIPGAEEMKLCPQRMSYAWGHKTNITAISSSSSCSPPLPP